jgi:arylsulfatase
LDEWGLADNTLVVFMTDNGHAINGPGQAGHAEDGFLEPGGLYNAGMRGGKAQPWEGGTRVPCFFRWPGTLERGRDLKGLAGGIDFLPTLADLCGATVPDGIDGRSLVPLIEGGDNQWPERRLVAHVGRWPMGLADEYRYRQFAVRSQEYRFVNDTELHDMVQDPGEKQNVIGRHPDLVAEMRSFYDQWWDETRPLMSNE